MYPELFRIAVPEFLQGFLPAYLNIHSYGFCIAMGIIAGYLYTYYNAKKAFGTSQETISNLLVYIIVAAVVGGKFFFYLEDPAYYFGNPSNMLKNFSGGFVFYGSLLFVIPVMLWFFKKNKIPVFPMLDIMAVTTPLVHAFGRLGCFLAGCCHGIPTEGACAVVFSDPHSAARPLNVPLHPTQLYSVVLLSLAVVFLLIYKKRKKFEGELFALYLILYPIGRFILEYYRGDEARGYVIQNALSHSQFISIFVIGGAIVFYFYLRRRSAKKFESGKIK